MRRAFVVLAQILAAGIAIAAIGGLIGVLIVHFADWGGALKGFTSGMIVGGVLVFFVAGGSGGSSTPSPGGRFGLPGYVSSANVGWWAAAPTHWIQVALSGVVAVGAGIGVIALFGF